MTPGLYGHARALTASAPRRFDEESRPAFGYPAKDRRVGAGGRRAVQPVIYSWAKRRMQTGLLSSNYRSWLCGKLREAVDRCNLICQSGPCSGHLNEYRFVTRIGCGLCPSKALPGILPVIVASTQRTSPIFQRHTNRLPTSKTAPISELFPKSASRDRCDQRRCGRQSTPSISPGHDKSECIYFARSWFVNRITSEDLLGF
jgi:hypothetical protein